MSIEALLELIRDRFSPVEGQTLLRSLQQDPAVWQFFQDQENSLPYFDAALNDLSAFQPGNMAVFLIEKETGFDLKDLAQLEVALPNQLKQHAAKALETVYNTGLPPSDLLTAGLVALNLRERRIQKKSWKGIFDEIFINRNQPFSEKNFKVWRTPVACLRSICPDYVDLLADGLKSKSVATLKASIPIFLHANLAQPIPDTEITDLFYSAMQSFPLDMQLESLKWLGAFHQPELQENLARNLTQTKANVDQFAKYFAEIEAARASSINHDPLDKSIRYSLSEDINRMAAIFYYSGNPEKAAEIYQQSQELLKLFESQTLFQSLVIQKQHTSPTRWLKLFQSIPHSNQARLLYIQSLVDANEIEEAGKFLQDMPPSIEKQLLEKQLSVPKNSSTASIDFTGFHIRQNEPLQSNYYIHKAKYQPSKEIITALKNAENPYEGIHLVKRILESDISDIEITQLARDYFEQVQEINEAIQLTSMLERLQPDQKDHKRSLARLYSIAERWDHAFDTLQGLIKSEPASSINDLERFGEAALKTNRIDMAIAICQNILKQDAKNTKALVLLGEGFMLNGDVVKAIQHMEQVIEMLPQEPDTWLTLARLWENCGQTDRAVEILIKGINAIPDEPGLLRAIGKAHLKQQSPADAQPVLQKAFELDPDNEDGKLHLAQAQYLLGQNDQARELLEPFLSRYENNPFAAKLLGNVLLAQGEEAQAEPILLRAAELSPEDTRAILTAAEVVISRTETNCDDSSEMDLDRVEKILNNALVSTSEHPVIQLHLADLDRLRGNYQTAFDAYSKLLENAQENGLNHHWRLRFGFGKSAIAVGKLEIGLAAMQDETSRNPENVALLRALAEAYQVADLPGKAHSTAKAALNQAPQSIENILWYAIFKSTYNEPNEAVKALKDALLIDPDRPVLKLTLAKSLISIGLLDESKSVLTDLVSGNHANTQELHQAGYIFVHLNELNLAAAALEKSLELSTITNPDLMLDLAVVYSLSDQNERALEILNVPVEELKKHPELAIIKSDLQSQKGDYKLACNTLKSVENKVKTSLPISQNSDNNNRSPLLSHFDFSQTGFLYRLGELNQALGNTTAAQSYFSDALAIQPEDSRLRNAAAEACFIGCAFEKALETIAKYPLPKEPVGDQVNMLCTQAEIYFLQNDADLAVKLFKQHQPEEHASPRFFAVQSQIANHLEDIDLAKEYLGQAINAYEKNLFQRRDFAPHVIIKQVLTESSIAEAALSLENHTTALQYHQQSWRRFGHQPLLSLRFLHTLIKSAEFQRIANAVAIVNHAPGKEILSEENYQLHLQLFEEIQNQLSHEEKVCLKARAESAFEGQWPLQISADACLVSAEDAAAVILGSDDENLATSILDTYPEDQAVLQAYGIFALKNHLKNGIQAVEKALTIDTSNPINHALLGLLTPEDPERALHSIKTALSFWPDEPEWHVFAADQFAKMGTAEEAEYHINQAIEHQPENPVYWQKSAEIKLQTNDLSRAKDDLEKSASFQSKNPAIWIKMAEVNRRLGFVSDAIENMNTASALRPEDAVIAEQEVRFLIDQKHFNDAEIKAETILQSNPQNLTIRILAARAKTGQGKFEQAKNTLIEMLQLQPGNPELLLELSSIRKEQEGVDAQLPVLIKLAQEHPDNPNILTTLTDWLIQANRLDEAKETAQTVLKIIPDQADVHLMLGRLQKKRGQLDQAITHLSHAITCNPKCIEAYIELGKTYQDRHNLEEAINVFQKGAKVDASDPRPYYFAGLALKECKDYTNAETMLKQAKKYSPDDSNIIRQLGVITALNLINNLRETS